MISAFKFIKLNELTLGSAKNLLALLQDFPIAYNEHLPAFSTVSNDKGYTEPELGDLSGKKFEQVKNRIFSGFEEARTFLVDLEFLPEDGTSFVPFSLKVFSMDEYSSIGIWISRSQIYQHDGKIHLWFQPLFIELFRQFKLETWGNS